MAVDVRKEEIDKLEKRAAQREEALRNAERMLEEDKKRFDLFLKENDERVREATKRAEKEAKKKREKARKVRRKKAMKVRRKKAGLVWSSPSLLCSWRKTQESERGFYQ